MSGIIDWFQNQLKHEAHHLVMGVIPKENQDHPVDDVILIAEKHYLRVWLVEMFLRDDHRLFREFVPVVHSVIRLQFGDKPAQELPYVAGPQNIGLGTTLGKGVQINHPLTNLLPYRGGTVSISAALLAYKSKDFFNGFSNVLSGITGLLNVGQLSSTLKIVNTAIDGIQNLLGASDKDVHLLFFQGFGGASATGGASLRAGYIAIINADSASFSKEKLFIKESGLCFGNDLNSAKPLANYDYMLLRIEACQARDDFMTFDTFAKLLIDAIREGQRDRETGNSIIKTAAVLAWSSPDLTNVDRLLIAKSMQQIYEQALSVEKESEKILKHDLMIDKLNRGIMSFDKRLATIESEGLVKNGKLQFDKFMDALSIKEAI